MKPLSSWLLSSLCVALAVPCSGAVIAKANVVYGQADGKPLRLDYCLPGSAEPMPAVILVHGGGWIAGNKLGDTKPLLAPLTRAGFAWFTIDYRLAPEHRYPACLDDVYTAIRWVKAHAGEMGVDPRRIALLGESAGGYLAEMAAVEGPPDTRVAAVITFFGPCDLLEQVKARGLKRDLTSLFGRTSMDPATTELLRSASPLNHIHPGLPPFLLLHGTADRIVPYDESVHFADQLKVAGVPEDLILVPGGVHAMGNWNKVDPAFKDQLIEWLQKTLAPKAQVIAAK